MKDTIIAVSTSMATAAGINIIRLSGENALLCVREIFENRTFNSEKIIPNTMYLGKILGKNFNDRAFCIYYKAPKSYTGEDVTEIHCHGGKVVTEAIVRLLREKGARPAEAGEFTKRAFLNGKLSLEEAEGVIDIINASSESEIKNAYRLMDGELGKNIEKTEKMLIETSALLEAVLDYPEELTDDTRPEAEQNLEEVNKKLELFLDTIKYTKILTEGVQVAIVGTPNSGKSSLINALCKKDRAIVTDIPGTTRDVLDETLEIDGIKIVFLDTAGIRQGENVIERIGIEKSRKAIENADVVLFVRDTSVAESNEEKEIEKLLKDKKTVYVANKIDVNGYPRKGIQICAKSGKNVEKLFDEILHLVNKEAIANQSILTNERHIFALQECKKYVEKGLENYHIVPTECTIAEIRNALEELGKITGKNVSDAVIEEVFSRFCVGK